MILKCIQRLSTNESIKDNGEVVQAYLVKALESSSQWVNLYEATGQLHVPDLAMDASVPTSEVETVKKVSQLPFSKVSGPNTRTGITGRYYDTSSRRQLAGDCLKCRCTIKRCRFIIYSCFAR